MRTQALKHLRTALNRTDADFRPGQWESIEDILNRKRLLVVERTGWGKSMVYFLATRLLRDKGAGVSLLISPLLSLMRNQLEAASRIGVRVCEIHTGPYAHAFHGKGRDAESPAVLDELAKIRVAGAAICAAGMRFNAGHALNYFNVQPVAALPRIRELHIGHAIVSRAVFVGMREAVREMKRLMREAAAAAR